MEADLAGAVTGIKALMEVPFLLAGGLFGTEVLSYPHDCCSRMHLCAGAFPVYATILSAAFSACLLYGAGADSVYPDVKWIGKRAVSIHIRAVCIPLSAAGAFCLCANIFGYVHVDGCDLCKPIGRILIEITGVTGYYTLTSIVTLVGVVLFGLSFCLWRKGFEKFHGPKQPPLLKSRKKLEWENLFLPFFIF